MSDATLTLADGTVVVLSQKVLEGADAFVEDTQEVGKKAQKRLSGNALSKGVKEAMAKEAEEGTAQVLGRISPKKLDLSRYQ